MYLKSLELHGFKSFPDKTVLNFERGATVVLGPNGSGKSNISDAMKWVLGEISSRNIRGNKMEDVIFGGTNDRRPMGFAEVSVTFDNTDEAHKIDSPYDEITVTRRYYRAGDSEYMINKKPVRLKDIHELFMNTGIGREGYSIIGQGKVAEMISKKSEDRRNIFEEAAGISKYRYKKQEAERKLADTDANMVRIKDIWLELDARIGPLEKAAEKARKYKVLLEEKKQGDVSLWLYDTQKIRDDITKADNAYKLAANEYDIISESLNTLESQSDRLQEQVQHNMVTAEEIFDNIRNYQTSLSELENRYQIAKNERKHEAERIDEYRASILELEENIKTSREELAKFSGEIDDAKKKLAAHFADKDEIIREQSEISAQISDIEKLLAQSLDRLTKLQKQTMDCQARIDVLNSTKATNDVNRKNLIAEIGKYEEERLKLRDEAEKSEKNAEGFKNKIAECEEKISEAAKEAEELRFEKENAQAEINRIRLERSTLIQRANTLQQMEEHLEGYSDSVRFVMNAYAKGEIQGAGKIYGPLSKLINIEDKYVTAIETALAASVQHIVVDSDKTAKAAIAKLKSARAGRATFYPVTEIRSQTETDEIVKCKNYDGYVGRADTLVDCDGKFREIVGWLLVRTVVFDNIENASIAAKALKYKVKLVTLDGQVINAGGSYTGGSVRSDAKMLSRAAQIEKMYSDAEKLQSDISERQKEVGKTDEKIAKADADVKEAEQQKNILLTLSRTQFAAIDSANAKLEANEDMLTRLRSNLDDIERSDKKCDSDISTFIGILADSNDEIDDIRKDRLRIDGEREELQKQKEEKTRISGEMLVDIAEIRKDIETKELLSSNTRNVLNGYISSKDDYMKRIEEFSNGDVGFENSQKENLAECEKIRNLIAECEKKRAELQNGNGEFEKRQSELKVQIRNKRTEKELSFRNLTNTETKLAKLREDSDRLGGKLLEEQGITYEDAVKLDYPPVTKENRGEVASALASVRAKIRALGDINPSAEEEFGEVKVRYDELSAQLSDLNKSHDDLTEILSKIEEEMKIKFVTAFTEINKNFGVTFSELFGGGTGELSLVDPENVLTSGIEIKAAPPGKIIKSLSLLSGGEQAFVAIALFFAILKLNPTPFCILDEIEAALDEVNVYRFGEYIKKFSDGTQFVLITHRRGTMEVGDRLYGVTMPERGVSKVIPLKVGELESRKKELLDGIL